MHDTDKTRCTSHVYISALDVICRYTSVEFGLRWPNNCWIKVWLTPSSSAWHAKQCLIVWGVTPSGRPSLCACSFINCSTVEFVSGSSLTVLGNSHPIGRGSDDPVRIRLLFCGDLTIPYLGLIYHCFLFEKADATSNSQVHFLLK